MMIKNLVQEIQFHNHHFENMKLRVFLVMLNFLFVVI